MFSNVVYYTYKRKGDKKMYSAKFYYKVLRFLLKHATRKEIDNYLNELLLLCSDMG